jgi:methionine transaminase
VGPRTRMIIINTPHNPTGTVLSAYDMTRLQQLVCSHALLVLSDEVYEHIVFDGVRHESVLRYPALAQRAFVVSSFGKTYHATGWKVGYCVAPPALSAEFRKVHQFVTFCTSTPMQHALAEFLVGCPEHYRSLPSFYQAKRDTFCALLQGSRFRFTPAKGTYFQIVDYSAISDLDDVSFAKHLTTSAGVAAIPVSVFCQIPLDRRLVRLCFAKDDRTLQRAAEILRKQ